MKASGPIEKNLAAYLACHCVAFLRIGLHYAAFTATISDRPQLLRCRTDIRKGGIGGLGTRPSRVTPEVSRRTFGLLCSRSAEADVFVAAAQIVIRQARLLLVFVGPAKPYAKPLGLKKDQPSFSGK